MKYRLRNELRLCRNTLSDDEVFFKSQKIVGNALPYIIKGKHIGVYMAFGKEVQTTELISYILEVGSAYVPKIEKEDMDFYQIHKDTCYEMNAYQIQEPIATKKILPQQLDIIFVPLVGFNKQKHRIGYGKGYYDRYLKKTNATTIGLAYECQLCNEHFQDAYDIALDMIITEEKVY